MGGCRCTYKNCSLKSDGVTHLFHYPVFDKVRCHQWLTNAQKLEFLNLKLSQLKNRVVCQYHFKDDNFMNFRKDKLTFDAVPTLDGPYCDTNQLATQKPEQDISKLYSISLEDIENEYLTFNDKKANFSVKYGDFLTNCDLMELDSMNVPNDYTQIKIKDNCYEEQSNIILNNSLDQEKVAYINPCINNIGDAPSHNSGNKVITINVTEVPLEYKCAPPGNVTVPSESIPQHQGIQNNITVQHSPKQHTRKKNNRISKKITILDEKQILDSASLPLPFAVKLEPICPSAILSLSHKRKNINLNLHLNNQENDNKHAGPDLVESLNVTSEEQASNTDNLNTLPTVHMSEIVDNFQHGALHNIEIGQTTMSKGNVPKSIQVSMQDTENNSNIVRDRKNKHSLLKNKIPPERMAAIEEKRKFNMKLRDIIASCLDKLDAEETDHFHSKVEEKLKKNITQKVTSYLSKEVELPSMQDYTVAYLEAKMKKMEETLLSKINHKGEAKVKNSITRKVNPYPSEEHEVPSMQDYTVAYLESRMKKMEDTLLSKIDQNSQRIMDLRKSLAPSVKKKMAYTQTQVSEELQKKHLFKEISKFLSPQAHSLLYEELFINKYRQKSQSDSPTKKRKYW